MRNYFIYQYEDLVSSKDKLRITAIFIHQAKILKQNTLAQEINSFLQEKSITDKIVVIIPEYLDKESLKFFFEKRSQTFERVPGNSSEYLDRNLIVYQFKVNGKLDLIFGKNTKYESKFKNQLLRSGSTIIFNNNGGLVESTPDHHFVFPSKKHCSKFIRTGNVLIHQAEIFFLAIQLLNHFENRTVIYCDTSSINVIPYTVFELLRRFKISFECPTVISFESYELFESSKESFPPDSLVLISSSTSGNIIDRILNEKRADQSQIQVIYFLGSNNNYQKHKPNIICNLTKDDSFLIGEIEFETFDTSKDTVKCRLCLDNSRPIPITSDVFLTIQPKIEKVLLYAKPDYAPKNIESFVEKFRTRSSKDSVIKVFYKDNDANKDYEIYFDVVYLLEHIEEFPLFKKSLNRQINKHIPANTKYLLHLPDIGSENLAKYIDSKIPSGIKPEFLKFNNDFAQKIDDNDGSMVIVASCITTGKKLLQISRLMRNKKNLNLIYFTGIFRPINDKFSDELISDLKKGKDKSDERPFVFIEKINCSIQQLKTSWEKEQSFLTDIYSSIDEEQNEDMYNFINNRLDVLRSNKDTKGLSDNVFLKKYTGESLYLRDGFAFWSFHDYSEADISQSEVYFTISAIFTNLENKNVNSTPSLKQANYVRNILSPRNFDRFNDGIIQSALLRCGKSEYFSYDLDSESSLKMKEFLISIIEKYDSEDGEALLEFILAIGLKKLKFIKEDLIEVLTKAKECENKIISGISQYVFNNI